MTKLNLILLAFLLASALATVASTNHARKLFIELENGQSEQKRIEVEWGQLQLEQSTWAKHALVESLASKQLGMKVPDAARTQFVTAARLPPAPSAPAALSAPGAATSAPSAASETKK